MTNNDAPSSESPSAAPALANLRLGTAPDSWGVWFPDDPKQVPWHRFLDEAAAAGYTAVELGPFGYLPTEPEQLRGELGRRGLILSGATAGTALHRGPGALSEALEECRRVAALVAALDAPYLITLPAMFTDLYTGELLEPAELTSEQWKSLGDGHTELGRALLEEFGVRQMFHPHADAHVESEASIDRFLEVTDPGSVSLCLDTGHIAYGGGDNRGHRRETPEPDRLRSSEVRRPRGDRPSPRRAHLLRRRGPAWRHGRARRRRAGDACPVGRPRRPCC